MKDSLFWQISHPDITVRPSVVFGTMHLCVDSPQIIDRVNIVMDEFDSVYTETSLDVLDSAYMYKYITLPDTGIWEKYMSEKQFNKARAIFIKAYGIDLTLYRTFRPLMIMGLMYQSIHLSDGQSEKLDEYIWQRAKHYGKQTDGIESIEEQARVMKMIPYDYDFGMLKKWAKNVSTMNRQLKKLISVYYEEDVLALHKKSSKSLGALRSILLYDRNIIMADRIEKWHQQAPAFFTFGAGHLAGRKGVLTLLKKKGFTVLPY